MLIQMLCGILLCTHIPVKLKTRKSNQHCVSCYIVKLCLFSMPLKHMYLYFNFNVTSTKRYLFISAINKKHIWIKRIAKTPICNISLYQQSVTYIRGLLLYNAMYFSVMIECICVLLELGQNASLLEITFRSLLKYSALYNRDYCSLDAGLHDKLCR